MLFKDLMTDPLNILKCLKHRQKLCRFLWNFCQTLCRNVDRFQARFFQQNSIPFLVRVLSINATCFFHCQQSMAVCVYSLPMFFHQVFHVICYLSTSQDSVCNVFPSSQLLLCTKVLDWIWVIKTFRVKAILIA